MSNKTLPSIHYCFRTAVVHTAYPLTVLYAICHSLMRTLLYQVFISWKPWSNVEENSISGRHKVVSVNALLLQTQNASRLMIQFFLSFLSKVSFISYPPVSSVWSSWKVKQDHWWGVLWVFPQELLLVLSFFKENSLQ